MEERDLGYEVGLMNKIVGGVLVVQERAQVDIISSYLYSICVVQ